MKYLCLSAILIVGILLLNFACTHEHSSATHKHDNGLSASAEAAQLSYTLRTDKSELFVEFPALIAGSVSRFAAHFTEMEHFKAIDEGTVELHLVDDTGTICDGKVPKPSSPGIFRPSITPPNPGSYTLKFILNTSKFSDTILIPEIEVYSNTEASVIANPTEKEGDAISFLKEQAWKIDFAIAKVPRRDIHKIIHTSGEILPIKGEQKIVSAKSTGIVSFKSRNLHQGREVRAGEILFSISSKGLLQSNLEEKYKISKARVDKTKADFDRAEILLAEHVLGLKEYERRKMEYAIADAEFKTVTSSYHENGQEVSSQISGIIKNVLVSDGQFVNEGTPLAEITSSRRLILRADVSQQFLPELRSIISANFKTPYQDRVHSIDEYNGKLISYGKMIDEGSGLIPVLFELDNFGELLPGSFAELFLLTKQIKNALAIPRSAVMEDYLLHYVYIQTKGESFEKRHVKLGVDDGFYVQILSGIAEGEWVVTKGAYQIKMASMSSVIPAHGHEH